MRSILYPNMTTRQNLKKTLTYMKNQVMPVEPSAEKLEFLTVEERLRLWQLLDEARRLLDEEG